MNAPARKVLGRLSVEMSLKLEVVLPSGEVKVAQFKDASVLVGRGKNCQMQIMAEDVSRNHLLIELVEGKVFLTDQGSSNGTFINNERLPANEKIEFDTFFIPIYLGKKITLSLSIIT